MDQGWSGQRHRALSLNGQEQPVATDRFQASYCVGGGAPGARLHRMSSWNYRVVKGADGLRIFDVYYDDSGRPTSTHATASYVCGETLDDLDAQLKLMKEALTLSLIHI